MIVSASIIRSITTPLVRFHIDYGVVRFINGFF